MPELLPNENQVLEVIPKLLAGKIDCAKRLLAFGPDAKTRIHDFGEELQSWNLYPPRKEHSQ